MRNKINRNAFTLIELILTVAIMGSLVTLFVVKYPASVQRARDVQRQNDLKSYQNALELYAMKHQGLYPTSGYVPITTLCSDLGMDTQACKNDPKGGTYYYESNSSGTKYTTWTSMEKTANSFVVCSGGLDGMASVTPASGICPNFEVTVYPTEPGGGLPTDTPGPTNTPVPSSTPMPTSTPAPVFVKNSNSNNTCHSVCLALGKSCLSIGTDTASAINTKYWDYVSACTETIGGVCSTKMDKHSPAKKCPTSGSNNADWTYCKCQ